MYVAIMVQVSPVIQFREDTRIPGTNKKKTFVIKTLGNYERMLAQDPDIIAKLKDEAAAATKAKKESVASMTIKVPVKEITSPDDVVPSFRFGHALIKQLWSNMALDDFFLQNCASVTPHLLPTPILSCRQRCADPSSYFRLRSEQVSYAGIDPLGLDILYDVLDVSLSKKMPSLSIWPTFLPRRPP